ncbi:hypothetical protein MO973_10720 [Paenibacillus sp. TRM 82003]|nr:hypothetical protein [Paenibacillus sp. TRM 82003]
MPEVTEGLLRSRREHDLIRSRIRRIEAGLEAMRGTALPELAMTIRKEAQALLAESNFHQQWEDDDFVPALSEFIRLQNGPDIGTTAWMLETNHHLAVELINSFLQKTKALSLHFDAEAWGTHTRELHQACELCLEQMELEEALLFAPARLEETVS